MLKAFLIITVLSALLLWYLREHYTEKIIKYIGTAPYLSLLLSKFQFYVDTIQQKSTPADRTFSLAELKQYNGKKGSQGIYISILGRIFDVQKGKRHYGPGGAYHVFAGRDASRSFISGDFTGTITDDVIDLTLKELLSLRDWLNFFEKEYTYKGKLIGRYFNSLGEKTDYSKELDLKFNEAEMSQKSKTLEETQFPPCNVEWTADTGSRVWCTNKSGGIERNWTGVPRKLYKVGSDSFRCACVDLSKIQDPDSVQYARRGHIKEYEECHPQASSCYVKS